jgi:hypothetical protein
MAGTVVGKSMNYGYPGSVSRSADAVIMNRPVQSTDSNSIPFGAAVILNTNNTYSLGGASTTMSNFAGIAVREVKQSTSFVTTGQGQVSYAPGDPCDVLERGSVTVTCTEGVPTAGGAVYLVTTAGTGAVSAVGNFIANATPAGTGSAAVQITNAQWKTGKIDANNTAELTLTARNKG